MANIEKQVRTLFIAQNETREAFQQIKSDLESLKASSANAQGGVGTLVKGIAGATIVVKAMDMAVQGAKKAVDLFFGSIGAGAELQMMNTALDTVAGNLGVTRKELEDYRKELANINTYGKNATEVLLQFMQTGMIDMVDNIKWASGKEGFEGYIETVKNFGATMGVTSSKAIDDFTTAIASLRPEMLEQYNITENLPMVFKRYAESIGKTGAELNETEKRMALMNLVAERGANVMGVYADTYETTGKNLLSIRDSFKSMGEEFGVTMQGLVQPLTGEFLGMLHDILDSVEKNSEAFTIFFTSLSELFGWAIDDINTVRTNTDEWVVSAVVGIGKFIKGLNVTIIGFKLIGGAIKSVYLFFESLFKMTAGGFVNMYYNIKDVVGIFKTWVSGVQKFFDKDYKGALNDFNNVTTQASNLVSNAVQRSMDNVKQAWDPFNKNIDDMVGNMNDMADVISFDVDEAWAKALKTAKNVDKELRKGSGGFKGYGDSAKEAGEKVKKALEDIFGKVRTYTQQLMDLVKKHKESYSKIQADLDAEKKARDESIGKVNEESTKKLEALRKRSAESIAIMKRAIETEKLLNDKNSDQNIMTLQDAIDNEKKAQEDREAKLKEATDAEIKEIQDKHAQKIAELEKNLAEEYEIQKKYAKDFAKFKDEIAEDDITRLKRQTAEEIKLIASKLGMSLSALGINLGQLGLTIPKYAEGTNFHQGGFALVGERGPEILNLPRGSQVIPLDKQVGDTYNVHITGNSFDSSQRVDEVVKKVVRELGRKNENARYNMTY